MRKWLQSADAPDIEVPAAEVSTTDADDHRIAVPAGADAAEITVTGDAAYVNFVESDSAPAAVGRRVIKDIMVQLFVPSRATHLNYKRVAETDVTLNIAWLF